MSITTERKHDTCPHHPDSILITTERWEPSHPAAPKRGPTLIQYRCGENCDTPLGWTYHHPINSSVHGPGQCRDEQVIKALRTQEHTTKTNRTTPKAVTLVILILFIIAGIFTFVPNPTTAMYPTLGILTVATIGVLGFTHRRQAQNKKLIHGNPTPPETHTPS